MCILFNNTCRFSDQILLASMYIIMFLPKYRPINDSRNCHNVLELLKGSDASWKLVSEVLNFFSISDSGKPANRLGLCTSNESIHSCLVPIIVMNSAEVDAFSVCHNDLTKCSGYAIRHTKGFVHKNCFTRRY